MAIARDTYQARTTQSPAATSYTFSYTVTGDDPALVFYIEHDTANTITGVTYDGVAMTIIHDAVNAPGPGVDLTSYILIGPSTGANNIVSSADGSIQQVATLESYTGVATGGSTGGSDASNTTAWAASSDDQSISTTTVADNAWITFNFRSGGGGDYAASTNVSIQDNVANIALVGDTGAAIATAGSTTQTWTHTGADNAGTILTISLAPAAAATATPSSTLTLLGAG